MPAAIGVAVPAAIGVAVPAAIGVAVPAAIGAVVAVAIRATGAEVAAMGARVAVSEASGKGGSSPSSQAQAAIKAGRIGQYSAAMKPPCPPS